MAYALGVVLFALGILVSVCLHEAGHMGTAKAFGMKVTRYFVGFGPTLWSFRRGETEYGVKAIPAGGFVKIVGMTPLEEEEEVGPDDRHRVFWRKPLWQRSVVLSAGSASHFVLGFVVLWAAAAFIGLPNNPDGGLASRAQVGVVAPCVVADRAGYESGRECAPGDPESPAKQIGLKSGDVVTAVDGIAISNWSQLVEIVRDRGGKQVSVTYERDGVSHAAEVTLPVVERPKLDANPNAKKLSELPTEKVGAIGVSLEPWVTVGPVQAVPMAGEYIGTMFVNIVQALPKIPQKIPALWHSLTGAERDPETPISVVGASRLGGEIVQHDVWPLFWLLLATLNLFVGVLNMLPLLPFDGGHLAIAWFERVRGWLYARFGKPDPGRVDYTKLMPVTYAIIVIFGAFSLLTVAADIVNPIQLFSNR